MELERRFGAGSAAGRRHIEAPRFDALARAFGAGRTRRGFVGLLAALAAGGVAGGADAKKRRRRCKPACGAQQTCVDRECVCSGGGTPCGTACCAIGQVCREGECTAPQPPVCIPFGEACKNVGRPCCESLVCGSGQGGQSDVACYVGKTGRCASTAECTFGTECVDGICVGLPVCNVPLGEVCGTGDICCAGTCQAPVPTGGRIPDDPRCCVGIGQSCSRPEDCCVVFVDGDRASRSYGPQCVNRVCALPPG